MPIVEAMAPFRVGAPLVWASGRCQQGPVLQERNFEAVLAERPDLKTIRGDLATQICRLRWPPAYGLAGTEFVQPLAPSECRPRTLTMQVAPLATQF